MVVTSVRAEPSRTQPLQLQLTRSLSFHAGPAQLSLKGRTLQHGAEVEARCQLQPWQSQTSRPHAQRGRMLASSTSRPGRAVADNNLQSSRPLSTGEEAYHSVLSQTSATAGLPGLLHGLWTYTAHPKALMPTAEPQLPAAQPGNFQHAGQPRRQLRRARIGRLAPAKSAAAQQGPGVTRQRLQASSVATPHMPGEAPCCSAVHLQQSLVCPLCIALCDAFCPESHAKLLNLALVKQVRMRLTRQTAMMKRTRGQDCPSPAAPPAGPCLPAGVQSCSREQSA